MSGRCRRARAPWEWRTTCAGYPRVLLPSPLLCVWLLLPRSTDAHRGPHTLSHRSSSALNARETKDCWMLLYLDLDMAKPPARWRQMVKMSMDCILLPATSRSTATLPLALFDCSGWGQTRKEKTAQQRSAHALSQTIPNAASYGNPMTLPISSHPHTRMHCHKGPSLTLGRWHTTTEGPRHTGFLRLSVPAESWT